MSPEKILEAVGVICELAAMMRGQLEGNGFTREEAVRISGEFVVRSFTPKVGENDETD